MNITKKFEANNVGRDFVVGDLHGMYDLFLQKLKELDFDKSKDRMFCVGDLIDRGPKSNECLELLFENWFFSNRGNHEDMMISSLRMDGNYSKHDWYNNGGSWAIYQKFSPDIINKLLDMPLISVVKKTDGSRVNIVHAELPSNSSDTDIDNESFTLNQCMDLMWRRYRSVALQSKKLNDSQKIMFENIDKNISQTYAGHTIFKKVKKLGKHIFIDTGAYMHGNLTIIEL